MYCAVLTKSGDVFQKPAMKIKHCKSNVGSSNLVMGVHLFSDFSSAKGRFPGV